MNYSNIKYIALVSLSLLITSCSNDSKLSQVLSSKFSDIRKYYAQDAERTAKKLGVKINPAGNITVSEPTADLLLETQAGTVVHMNLDIKETKPCNLKKPFNAAALLNHAGISTHDLRLVSSATHNTVYMDDANRFKISVTCRQNGVPISIGVSRKYYQR